MDCSAAATKVIELFFPPLTRKRQEHSMSVAVTAARLCLRFGLDAECGRLAGLAHDIARELPLRVMAVTAAKDGRPVLAFEKENPLLLHGRAAAVLLSEKLMIGESAEGAAVLEAIRDHTLGRAGMGPLSKVIYIADFLEPGRKYLKNKDFRAAEAEDLDEILFHVAGRLKAIYKKEGTSLLEPSLQLFKEVKDKVALHDKKR